MKILDSFRKEDMFKDSLAEFDHLGDRWNGDCTEITFQRNR